MFNFQKFHRLSNILVNTVRYTGKYQSKHNKSKLYKEGDGLKIENFIRFYPRVKGTSIEEVKIADPPKLFRVTRIKKIAGNPHWEKRILRDFGLFDVIFNNFTGSF